MPASGEVAKRVQASTETGHFAREDGEYERLVISGEDIKVEGDTLQHQIEKCDRRSWWMKAVTFCIISILLSYILMKWGMPFLFEKVKN